MSVLPPFQEFLDKKKKIRRAIEAAGIPYTFVSANCYGAYFVNFLLHPHDKGEDIIVYGSGEAKGIVPIFFLLTLFCIRIFFHLYSMTNHDVLCMIGLQENSFINID